MRRATVLDLRKQSRATVLRWVLLNGPTTRVDVTAGTGLSAATVSNVVADLLAERLVKETGAGDSNGGRPRVGLEINVDAGWLIGVDLGETAVTVELFDLGLRRRDRLTVPVTSRLTPARRMAGLLDTAVRDLLSRFDVENTPLLGVGIGVPGIVEHGPSPVVHAQAFGWKATPFLEMLTPLGVPTLIDNGAKTLTRAEMWFGAGRGVLHGAVVLIGTGIGAGVISEGAIFRGSRSTAAEWGHTKVKLRGRLCRCGARGCLEAYAGAPGILASWREKGAHPPHQQQLGVAAWLRAVANGDPAAVEVRDEVVEVLGVGFADLVNLYNPQKIIIGGWVGLELGRVALGRLDRAMRANALKTPAAEVSLELCEVGPDAVALGAATLPVEHLIEVGKS